MKDLIIETADGFKLSASLFTGEDREGPAILISSACAVPRKIYRPIAGHLMRRGASHVLTYDYRGILPPGTRPFPKAALADATMHDWARKDMVAAAETLASLSGKTHLTGLGHSFGGQALGLCPAHHLFDRYVTVASGSGYLKNTAEPFKLNILMNIIGPAAIRFWGYMPSRMGLGVDLPRGVFETWRNWCNNPNYFMDDPSVAENHYFHDITTDMMIIGMEDDPWATVQAVNDLAKWYQTTKPQVIRVSPHSVGDTIGHFGFFQKQFENSLWPLVSNYLIDNRLPGKKVLKFAEG